MAPAVTSRDSSSKAIRKAAKKNTSSETTSFLGKVFAGAAGTILLPALLLVIYRFTQNENAADVQNLQSALETLQAALKSAEHTERSAESAVITLSGSVSDFVADHPDGAMVEFHMPDCDHCKKLKPDYEAAAKEFATTGGPPLASIDGEAYPAIAKEHGVDRYPTVLWFRRGKAVQELRPTSRTKEKIMEFVEWVQQPAFTEFETMAEFEEAVPTLRLALQEKSPPVVVGFASPAVQQALEDVGERLRGKVLFIYVQESVSESTDAENQVPSLRRYAANADDDAVFRDAVSPEAVKQWVESLLPVKK